MKRLWWKILLSLVVVLLAAVLGLAFLLGSGKELGLRHTAFAEPALDFENSSLADYIAYSREVVQAARLDQPSEDTINNVSAFLLEPDASCPRTSDGKWQRGIVLTHGLIDSAYSMRDVGEFFRDECFLSVGLLLPDHGTRPGDLLDSPWEKWAQLVHFATERVAEQSAQVILGGHSAGGTLAVYEAVQNDKVAGLILFAPAIGIEEAAKYAGLVSLLGSIVPGAAWLDVAPDRALYRYESFAFRAVWETWLLTQAVQEELKGSPLETPVLTVMSAEDTTVSTDAILDFMGRLERPSRTLVYSRYPLSTPARTRLLQSRNLEEGVLSLSHLGLMIAPDNPYYGRSGEYNYCGQYLSNNPENYEACMVGQSEFAGEITEENLQQGLMERIVYNPYYQDMLGDIRNFLQLIPED